MSVILGAFYWIMTFFNKAEKAPSLTPFTKVLAWIFIVGVCAVILAVTYFLTMYTPPSISIGGKASSWLGGAVVIIIIMLILYLVLPKKVFSWKFPFSFGRITSRGIITLFVAIICAMLVYLMYINVSIAHYRFKKGGYKIETPLPDITKKERNELHANDHFADVPRLNLGITRLEKDKFYKLPKSAVEYRLTPGQDDVDFHFNEDYRVIQPDRDCEVEIIHSQD